MKMIIFSSDVLLDLCDIILDSKVKKNSIKKFSEIIEKISINNIIKKTIGLLKKAGYKTAIISTDALLLIDWLQKKLGIDFSYYYKPYVNGNIALGPKSKVNRKNKVNFFRNLAKINSIITKECVFIGNNMSDIPFFLEAGLSIAFNPKEKNIEEFCDIVVKKDFKKILKPLLNNIFTKSTIKLNFDYKDANIITNSISPDNIIASEDLISAKNKKGKILVKIFCYKGLGTMFQTLDDLLSCIQISAEILKTIKRYK